MTAIAIWRIELSRCSQPQWVDYVVVKYCCMSLSLTFVVHA